MDLAAPVMVTGASGYVGERLSLALHALGAPVVGVYRSHRPAALAARGVSLAQADLAQPDEAAALLDRLRPAAVVHLAAMADVGRCDREPEAARAAIVGSTLALARAPRLLYLSTDLVYDGDAAPYGPHAPRAPRSLYGQLKAEAEDFARGEVVRAALVYGPRSGRKPGAVGWVLDALHERRPVSLFEDEFRTPLHLDDLIAALLALLARPASPGLRLNLGGPERLSRLDLGLRIARAFSLDPAPLLRDRLASSPLGPARPRDVSLDSASSWASLGLAPRDLDAGLRDCA